MTTNIDTAAPYTVSILSRGETTRREIATLTEAHEMIEAATAARRCKSSCILDRSGRVIAPLGVSFRPDLSNLAATSDLYTVRALRPCHWTPMCDRCRRELTAETGAHIGKIRNRFGEVTKTTCLCTDCDEAVFALRIAEARTSCTGAEDELASALYQQQTDDLQTAEDARSRD
jgi:hypothetical protein